MKSSFLNPLFRHLAATGLIVASSHAATYQWNGSASSDWTNASNWVPTNPSYNGQSITSGPAPVGGTQAHRVNINNQTGFECVYSATQGTTTYTGGGNRALVIGSGAVPQGGGGTLRITGGTLNTNGSGDVIGNSGNTAALIIDGGNYSATAAVGLGIGGSTATLTVNSGSAAVPTLNLTNTTGTINLNGGTLAANTITRGGGTNTINFNGGTLKARITSATFIGNLTATTLRVKSGGAVIDTSGDTNTGVDVTIAMPLLEDPASTGGGLVKNGLGTLTLTGSHTFTGGITVDTGTLALNPASAYTYDGNISGSGTISVGGAGLVSLGGSMTPGIVLANGGNLGGEGITSGPLTFAGTGNFFFNPATTGPTGHFRAASIDATGATVNFIAVGGTSAANGLVVMESTGSAITGTIGIAGSGATFIENSRVDLSFSGDNKQLLANYTPGDLVWKGNTTPNPTYWDNGTTANWFNNTTSSTDNFFSGDTVLFDDTASTGTVAIQGSALPSSVTFANNSLEYTISGGSITGTGTLTVSGPGTVNLTAANSYSGGTTLNGGVVNAPVTTSLGSGAVAVNTGATLNLTSTANGDFGYVGIHSGAATLAGAGTVNVSLGTGTATRLFNGNNSGFTGTMNIGVAASAGAGKAQILGNLGTGATVNMLEHASLYLSGATVNQPAAITLGGGDTGESLGQLRVDSGATWSGTVTLAGDITGIGDGFIGSFTGTGTISGAINESGGAKALSKVGGGRIISTTANGYTGATNILGGTLTIQNTLGLSGTGTTVSSGGSLELEGSLNMPSETLSLDGQGVSSLGALRSVTGNNTWNGTIGTAGICRIEATADLLTLNGDITLPAPGTNFQLVLQGNGTIDVNGIVSDNAGGATPLSSSQFGTGTRRLNAANTYTGVTNVNGGVLVAANSSALGSNAGGTIIPGLINTTQTSGLLALTGGITIAGEALTLGGRQTTVIDAPHVTNLSGDNTWTGNISFTTGGLDYNIESQSGLLTLSGQISGEAIGLTRNLKLTGAGNGEVSGTIIDGTAGTRVQITKRGAGTWTLSGTNTFSGNTVVEEGTLALASTGQMRFAPTSNGNSTSVTGTGTGTFTANGTFLLDLTGAELVDASEWLLVDVANLTESFGPNFTVTSSAGPFTNNAGVWTLVDGLNSWSFDQSTGVLSLAVTEDPYLGWINETWPELSDKTPGGDPDNDGIDNLLEYVLKDGNPSTSNPGILPTLNASGTDFVFTFHRRAASTADTTQVFQYGTNLSGWTNVPIVHGGQVAITADTPSLGIDRVVVTIPKGSNTSLFGRVQATK